MHDKWDEILRNKMQAVEADAPAGAWKKISAELHGRKKVFPFWIPAVAAAFALIIIVGKLRPGTEISAPMNSPEIAQTESIQDADSGPAPVAETQTDASARKVDASPIETKMPSVAAKKKITPFQPAIPAKEKTNNLAQVPTVNPPAQVKVEPIQNQSEVQPAFADNVVLPQDKKEDIVTTNRILEETQSAVKPVLTSIVNLASDLLGLDAGIEEKVENDKRAVVMNADLGFLSIRRKSTYRQQ